MISDENVGVLLTTHHVAAPFAYVVPLSFASLLHVPCLSGYIYNICLNSPKNLSIYQLQKDLDTTQHTQASNLKKAVMK